MKAAQIPLLLFANALLVSSAYAQAAPPRPSFDRVMIVVLENADYSNALKQPALARLAKDGALLTHFHAETHPSQGNYIALVAGNTYRVHSDLPVNLNVPHIGNLLDASGKSWKAYLEGYPGGCFLKNRSDGYVRKHNPFASFRDLQADPSRCAAHLVPASELSGDISAGTLPAFSLYVPNLKHDGHHTGIASAGRWFARSFGPLMKNPKFMQGMLLVVTFDEAAHSADNHIYTALYGAGVAPGSSSNADYDHYSLLRTIEAALGTSTLRQKDATATPITGVWK